jgi:hypothetical protein
MSNGDAHLSNVDDAADRHAEVVSRAQYAMDAATYRHPEDVQSGVFERQAEAQQR